MQGSVIRSTICVRLIALRRPAREIRCEHRHLLNIPRTKLATRLGTRAFSVAAAKVPGIIPCCVLKVLHLWSLSLITSKLLTSRFPALASRTKRYQSFINFGLLHYQ